MPPPRRLQRLQTRVGLALGGLLLCSAVLLALMLSHAAERQILQLSASNLESQSEQMARELSGGMDRFLREVLTQTYRDRFRDPDASPASMRAALDKFQENHPEFAYVAIVDAATATVLAASGGIFEGGNGRGRPVFDEGLKGPFLGDVHDAVRLAELLPRPSDGETLRFLDVSAPIEDASGKVFRVFVTHVAWEWTKQLREHVFGPLKERRGVEAILVDTAGKVVLAGAADLPTGTDLGAISRLHGAPAGRVTWADGRDYLTYVAGTGPRGRFPGFGWKVVARQPVEAALAPAHNLRNAFLAGALALGLAAVPLAWLVAGRLVRPVRLLAEAASATEAGAPVAAMPHHGQLGEVSAVQRALVRLGDSARMQALAARAVERQFAVLAESLPQVVWLADAHGALEYANKPWIRRRRPEGPFLVDEMAALIADEDRTGFEQAWRDSLASGSDLRVRCRVHEADEAPPRWFDIEARAVKAEDGSPMRWVGTLLDVHEMVQLAETMNRALAEERTARAEAERLARLRDEFLASVSHELRSPLSAITGWSEILARKAVGDPMLVKAADVIRRNAQLQVGLVSDLLDMSTAMAGKLVLERQPTDLASVARDTVLSHLHAAQLKGVQLSHREAAPVLVEADARRLSQVLANLVGNALKFTDAGGRIEVATSTEGGRAVVRVSDTGRGIAADFLPHVFDRMRQEDSSHTRRAGGLGLGLAISRALVELHQGAIEAESAGPGRGAIFSVFLPRLEDGLDIAPAAAGEAPECRIPADLGSMRILLVDDEADAREVAQVALASLGAEVRPAASAAEALQLLRSERFDVLVSDIGMPLMDGRAFVRAARQLPGCGKHELPAVALTAFAMESDRQAGLAAGFQSYVAKPISLGKLAVGIVQARQASRQPHPV
ncbi:ATP-binding protein [Caldimonas tepidiphila]|uniref:ATP-binding protein n=1 Tax=Caldimonas tepidiphila TaxID=2315841 RepID=UPI0013007EBA|nr:ATP-binding protein [Caldimonas tepidiphila]